MNKKSEVSMKIVAQAVLFVIVILVLGYIVYMVYKTSQPIPDYEKCQASIKSIQASKSLGNLLPISDLDCPTQYITVTNKGISQSEKEAVNAKMALEMQKCWELFGQGKSDLFDEIDSMYCHVCSVIDFSNKNIKIDDFNIYLRDKNAIGTTTPYRNYFAMVIKDGENNYKTFPSNNFPPGTIDGNNKYAIIYVYTKNKWFFDEYIQKQGVVKGSFFMAWDSIRTDILSIYNDFKFTVVGPTESSSKVLMVVHTAKSFEGMCTEIPSLQS